MDAHIAPKPSTEPRGSWKTTPMSDADLDEFTRMQYKAFIGTGNPLHDTLFPPASNPAPADFAKGTARHRAALAAEPDNVVYIKVVDEKTGEMAGAAKWCFYDKDVARPERAEVDWVEADEQEFAQRVMDEFHGRRVTRMKGPHALLDICFCNPAYERRGVASVLVDYGCRRADEMGVRAFTEASLRGQPVYARMGFVSTEHVNLKYDDEAGQGKQPVVWYHMEREPGATQGSTM